jgi:hypothetical protein
MAHATTPHTETQQNRKLDRTDLEPDQLEQTSGTGEDAELYRNNEGAQTGTDRAPEKFPDAASNLNTEQADEENVGQERVVRNRPDAQAGVNHSR